jgi:hypothetical protein
MTQGLPPKPTCLSIVGGILLTVVILAAFAFLPNMVKWVGAALTFVPAKLGLIRVVEPAEVIPVDMTDSPTNVEFVNAGHYVLYTANLDLLSINEAVLSAKAKPWFQLIGGSGEKVAISMVERGLAIYDTPLARGRPVALFEITTPGQYSMLHPRRPDFTYVVPDYTSGEEGAITFYALVQAVALGAAGSYVRRRTRKPPTRVIAPPPSALNRKRYEAEDSEALERSPTRIAKPWDEAVVSPHAIAEVSPAPDARDVLTLVQSGRLTAQQADSEIESVMLSQAPGAAANTWGAKLALSAFEAAAYAQGAGIADLMKLRFKGWPTACGRCGQELDHRQMSWLIVLDASGTLTLQHRECPAKEY